MSKSSREQTGGNAVSKTVLYNKASRHALEAIDVLISTMKDESVQGSVRVGAAKALLNKCLPDLKATELSSKDGEKIMAAIVYQPAKAESIDEIERPS